MLARSRYKLKSFLQENYTSVADDYMLNTLYIRSTGITVKDKITLFTYALPCYIGVILHTPKQNHSYILWESMCLFSVPLRYGVFP